MPERMARTDDFAEVGGSEVEDLLPVEFLAGVVDRWQRRPDVLFADVVRAGEPVVPQIEAWARAQGLELSTFWKVELAKLAKRGSLGCWP